jgi:heptosyltransferase III
MLRRLVIRPGGIGDCILALPAMQSLTADFTEVWVPSAVVPLIRFAGQVRAIAATGIDLLGLPGVEPDPRLIATLRGFDEIVSWYGSNRPEFRKAVEELELPFTFLQALPDPDGQVHCADFFLHQLGCAAGEHPRIDCGPVLKSECAAIHPFSGSARKNWPMQRYRELAEQLPLQVQWCAGPEEVLADAVRIDDLFVLGCWLGSRRIYIGNDSGITHLAAAGGARVVAIFGVTDPLVWAPRGERVRVVRGKLDEITVKEVLDAARALL